MMSTNYASLTERSPGGREPVAVVYADMVGYSHLIGLGNSGTLEGSKSFAATRSIQ